MTPPLHVIFAPPQFTPASTFGYKKYLATTLSLKIHKSIIVYYNCGRRTLHIDIVGVISAQIDFVHRLVSSAVWQFLLVFWPPLSARYHLHRTILHRPVTANIMAPESIRKFLSTLPFRTVSE